MALERARVTDLFVTTPDGDLMDRARAAGSRVVEVSDRVLSVIADTVTPQGTVGVVDRIDVQLDEILGSDLVVVLDNVRDPGNAGTIVRSAAAAGAGAVVFTRGSVDPLHPKTVRASAGALFAVPIVRDADLPSAIGQLRAAGHHIVGADARSEASMYETDLTQPTTLVFGNEAWGLPQNERELVDLLVGVPMPGDAESLNVAMAASVMLFEAARQRRLSSDSL